MFTIQRLIGDPKGDPVWPAAPPAVRTQIMDEAVWDSDDAPQFPGGAHYADDKIEAFLQGSTQYDALGHVWFGGKIWNGYDTCTTIGGLDHASIEPIARRGIVGRAVLLDIARWRGARRTWTRVRRSRMWIWLPAQPPRASKSAGATSC